MKIQDHFLAREVVDDRFARFYGVLTVDGVCVESPRFESKKDAEKWIADYISNNRNY